MACAVSSTPGCHLGAAPAPAPPRRRRRLDDLAQSAHLEVRPARDDELPQLGTLLAELIPGIRTPFSSFSLVHAYSKSIYTVCKSSSLVGCFACLHLNSLGLQSLLDGSLSKNEPQRLCLAEAGSRVEAIYAWAWAMRPPTNGIRAMGNLMAWLRRREFSEAEIYGRPTTGKGFGFAQNLDFRPVEAGAKDQDLWVTARFA